MSYRLTAACRICALTRFAVRLLQRVQSQLRQSGQSHICPPRRKKIRSLPVKTKDNLRQPLSPPSLRMEVIPAAIAVHGAVGAADGAEDVASVEANAAAIVGESAPSAVRQRRRPRGPLALPPDINRSCYPESRFQSTNAIRRHRFKKLIRPRQPRQSR